MDNVLNNIAPPYDKAKSYVKGDYCIYGNAPYICLEDTNGAFDSEKWKQVYLSEMISGDLNSNLGKFLDWSDSSKYEIITKSVTATDYRSVSGSVIEFIGANAWDLFRTNMNRIKVEYDKKPTIITANYGVYNYFIDVNNLVCVATANLLNTSITYTAIVGLYNEFYFGEKDCCFPFCQNGETGQICNVKLYYPK